MASVAVVEVPAVPAVVRGSIGLWVCAVATGVAETVLQVLRAVAGELPADGIAGQLGVRAVVYAALLLLVLRLRRGEPGTRWAVAVLIGGIGTLSMVGGPLLEMAHGAPVAAAWVDGTGASAWTFASLRAFHLCAVLGALALLFSPAANELFRRRRP
ncbi:hypothetical protein GCM10027271_12100 [Saccharopolyspora gloriosae]|uniref:DUF4149 domain-containing protein n=1 Tax=Saccharopolyspora gloriosae TaxID=455344 RepID=A0A840NU05_9PSEU|nr:hypothetical protein [Saccharopolyspora gloriosae]MBB5072749.1 hypothetical protein [Saccharopolyspora gloriosae]